MKRWLLVLVLCGSGSCARHRAPAVNADAPSTYLVPWTALDTDRVCMDTKPNIGWRPCMSVRELRLLLLSGRAN